ncbi:MAG: M14 family zinc carboxypeptidase [Fusobacteriaceae bacterium]
MKIRKKIDLFLKIAVLNFFLLLFSEKSYSNLEEHFPLLNLLISTPIFQRESIRFSTNEEIYEFLQKLPQKSPHVQYKEMELPSGERGIPYVVIAENGEYNPQKTTIWIQAMQHGDEHGSGEAALGLADFFSLNTEQLLEDINILIFPRLNMYGAERKKTFLRGNVDMNTDHALLSSPETKVLKKELLKYTPEVILDLHEYPASEDSFAKLPTKRILPYYDILLSPPTNINIPDSIKTRQKTDIEAVKNNLEKKGVTIGSYYSGIRENNGILTLQVPSSSIKIARNNFALIPSLSFLVEGRGKDLGLKFFQRRVGSLEETVVAFINNFKAQSLNIKNQISDERISLISKKDITVFLAGESEIYPDRYKFINLKTNKVENFSVNMLIDLRKLGAISRKAPLGYLVEAKSQQLITKLKRHGIIYSVLDSEKTFHVESFRKTPGKKEYLLESQEKIFPADTILVDLEQLQKLLILLLFEPESEASFANLGLIPSKDTILPYYRILERESH